jgi:hypothetical protein
MCKRLLEWRDRNGDRRKGPILCILSGVAGADALVQERWLVSQHDGWARLQGDAIARSLFV